MDPRGAHVLITGASSGIGRATALELARRGARLSLAARREAELEAVAGACRAAGAEARVFVADVSDRSACLALVAGAERELGPLDALVNNAGFAIFDPVAEADPAHAESMVRTNYLGTLWCLQAALPGMIERKRGSIVNVGSIAGIMGYARMGAYCASKFAVTGLTEALRSEVKGRGIDVSLVAPGTTSTDFFVTAEKGKMPAASRLVLAIPPERVARSVVRALESGKARIIVPAGAHLYMRFKEWMPGPAHFVMRLVSEMLERNRR